MKVLLLGAIFGGLMGVAAGLAQPMTSTDCMKHRLDVGSIHSNCTSHDQPIFRDNVAEPQNTEGRGPTVSDDGVISLRRNAFTLDQDEKLSCLAHFPGGGQLRARDFVASVTLFKDGGFRVEEEERGMQRFRSFSGRWDYSEGLFKLSGTGSVQTRMVTRDQFTGRVIQNDPFNPSRPKTVNLTRYVDYSRSNQIVYILTERGYGTVTGTCVF